MSAVKLRITGTESECAAAVTALAAGFEVREVSAFYPDRRGGSLGRVYVDAVPLTSAVAGGQADSAPRNVHQRIGSVEAGATVIGAVVGDRRPPRRPRPPQRGWDTERPTGGVW